MIALLAGTLGLFFAYAMYIATRAGAGRPEDHLDGGGRLPDWCLVFGSTGVVLAGLGLHDHFLLVARYGLQYSHVALGLVLVALGGTLVQKRLWLAARITGKLSPVELFGTYYGSVAIRLFMLALLILFAVPFAGHSLALIGDVVQTGTGGAISSAQAIWISAFFLFLFSAIGGWRGVMIVVAAQSFLVLALIAFDGLFAGATFDRLAFFTGGIGTAKDILADKIPGVLQYSSGIGKTATSGGIWTTLGILSFAVSLIGIVLSPGYSFLGTTSAVRSAFAFSQVWMIAGLAGGLLLLAAPIVGAEIAAAGPGDATLEYTGLGYSGLVARFGAIDQVAALCVLLLLLASLQIAVAFFTIAGANILTLDLVARFVLPDLTGAGRRLAARITLAIIYAAIALLATVAPASLAIVGAVTLSLSAQLLPAFLGLCWVPWISRSAVLTGLIAGSLMVILTEPPGLIAIEGLFFNLPWGRWPLTIHSAVWGLALNLAACLLVSIFTATGPDREPRRRLHDEFARAFPAQLGGSAARGTKWSLILIWTFLALGPGAILGNDFFSHPIFTDTPANLGVPSLWVWQILFWFVGILLVWWLAYQAGMSVIETDVGRTIDLDPTVPALVRPRRPAWLALLVTRVADRSLLKE